MSVGYEYWVNNERYQVALWFKKNNLTFRDACFETAKDIRARINKNLVLSISGGADSMLMYNIFKDLGIEVKTIHQRYWTKDPFPLMKGWKIPGLINEYESKYVDLDTVDVLQDIDIEDFQNSDFLKELVEYCPMIYISYIQSYIKFVLDRENDYLIDGGGICNLNHHLFDKGDLLPVAFDWSLIAWSLSMDIPLKGFNYTHFYSDNSTISYSRYISPKELLFDKKKLFEHYFPEYNHLTKSRQVDWPYIRNYKELRQEYGESRGYVVYNTWPYFGPPSDNFDNFLDYVKRGHPMTATGEWNRSKCSAYSLENINMLSYETDHFLSNTIPSKNL